MSHIGLNDERWWEDFKRFDAEDQQFFAEMLAGEEQILEGEAAGQRLTLRPFMRVLNETVEKYVKRAFLKEVDEVMVQDLMDTIRSKGFEPSEFGLTEEMVRLRLVQRRQRLNPAGDLAEDGAGIGGPDEGLGLGIVVLDEAVDRGLEVDDRAEHATLEPAAGEPGEEGLDRVQPGAGGRGEVEDEARMTAEPAQHLGVLVGGVVVEDDVDQLAGRHGAFDGVQEADELLVAMALHALADDGAVEHVDRGEQVGGAVALVIEGHRPGFARFHGQARLAAIERLDLRFLVDR